MNIISKQIRNSARDEDCTLQIAGVCNHNASTTVLAHFPDESKGIGKKSDDISAGFCCSSCHDAIDMRVRSEHFKENEDFYLRRAQTRTIKRLIELGVITIKGLK